MMAFAIQKGAYSYDLLSEAEECVLAVPGERLAQETLFCGINSGRSVDKVKECKLSLIDSEKVKVPGLHAAIANIEMRIVNKISTGDHLTAIGQVLRFAVNKKNEERCLVSVGPHTEGYQVVAQHGIHRIGIVQGPSGG
jgi:flavin reductase (DIM6/NTAB) family NADH-FMN oxidoreductase RutF